jgi:hypothetical protein
MFSAHPALLRAHLRAKLVQRYGETRGARFLHPCLLTLWLLPSIGPKGVAQFSERRAYRRMQREWCTWHAETMLLGLWSLRQRHYLTHQHGLPAAVASHVVDTLVETVYLGEAHGRRQLERQLAARCWN